MKVRCLIVDDEPLAVKLLEGYVNKTPFLQLTGSCNSVFDAMDIINNEPIDLLFLDIQMPEMNGVEFSRTLKSGIKVIFTTAFEQYALEGFKVDALDYLLKPFDYTEFLRAANKAQEWFKLTAGSQLTPSVTDGIFVKSEYKLIHIKLDEVLYFEGLKDYIKIHIENRINPILTLMSLKSLEEQLPENRFMRIHRSYIINLSKVDSVERGQVFIAKTALSIADNYKDKFNEYVAQRLKN